MGIDFRSCLVAKAATWDQENISTAFPLRLLVPQTESQTNQRPFGEIRGAFVFPADVVVG